MAFTRKSSAPVQRIEGEFPELPDKTEAELREWWLDTRAVLDRVRDTIDDIAEAQTTTAQTTNTTTTVTQNLTAPEIKSLYESNDNTNVFTNAEKTNLESLVSESKVTEAPERFLFTATTNQPQWEIHHQLGFYPNVQVYNSDLEEIFADIQHSSTELTLINFTGTTTGYAVLS